MLHFATMQALHSPSAVAFEFEPQQKWLPHKHLSFRFFFRFIPVLLNALFATSPGLKTGKCPASCSTSQTRVLLSNHPPEFLQVPQPIPLPTSVEKTQLGLLIFLSSHNYLRTVGICSSFAMPTVRLPLAHHGPESWPSIIRNARSSVPRVPATHSHLDHNPLKLPNYSGPSLSALALHSPDVECKSFVPSAHPP